MSPTASFTPSGMYGSAEQAGTADSAVQGCTRGGADGWVVPGVYWEGYTGVLPSTIPGSHIQVNPPTGPTHGQMKLN